MIARLYASARQKPPLWWALYVVYVAAIVGLAALWRPHLVPFGIAMVLGYLVASLAFPAQPLTRHRAQRSGTEHLAE